MNFDLQKLTDKIINIFDQNILVALLGKTLLALGLLVFFLVSARILRKLVQRVTGKTSRNANLPILLGNLTYVVILVVAALAILSVYTNQSLSTLLTLLGLLSLAISLSVQDVLKNFVAGVYLLLEQPFSIGDRIKVQTVEGKVETIEIRTTSLRTDDGVQVFIPNTIVFSEVVTNRTAYRQRLNTLHFSVPVRSISFEETFKKVQEIVASFEPSQVSADPAPQILVDSISAEKVQARLNYWSPITAPINANSEVLLALNKALPQLELSITPPAGAVA